MKGVGRQLGHLVRRRAQGRCEYCQLPQTAHPLRFPIDHIEARQHGGATIEANLALACYACNLHKGPNLAGLDPLTRRLTRLYHPRKQRWSAHFRWKGAAIVGRTAIGRTTIAVLAMNEPGRVQLRRSLQAEGLMPSAK